MVAAANRKGNYMTGNFEHAKSTGTSATSSRDESSASLVKAEDIITPEELAARLKVPDSWVYEKTRGRCRNPIPCLRLGRYVRFDWTAVATWLTAPAPQELRSSRPDLPKNRKTAAPIPR
jgi:excisionase family DNA binding protein